MSRKTLLFGFGTSFEAKRWLSLDPCGWLGVSLSWGVHLYALLVLPLFVLGGSLLSNLVYFFLYVPSAILALSSLFMASTTDPGAVPLGARPLLTVRPANAGDSASSATNRSVRRCHKCGDNYKPARAHHDSITGRCIVKFDHFCPWVNNAVGALNHKFFCLFLLYTAVTCLLSLLLLLLRAINCGFAQQAEQQQMQQQAEGALGGSTSGSGAVHSKGADPTADHSGGHRLLAGGSYADPQCDALYNSNFVLGLLIASLLFLIFTASMGVEQLEAINTGKGKIARMKMSVGATGTEFARVSEEFNEMFGGDTPNPTWHWFLPLAVSFPRGMKKVVLGYDWDESSRMTPYAEDYDDSGNSSSHGGDHELQDLERGTAGGIRVNSPSNVPLVGDAQLPVPPRLPSRSTGLDRENSTGSAASSLESGRGVKNRRPRSLEEPREVV